MAEIIGHGMHSRFYVITIITLTSLMLPGCMVGPDFHSPEAPHTTQYTPTQLPDKTSRVPGAHSGSAQELIAGRDIPADWWSLFHSSELNELIILGIHNSPNITAAQAALNEAKQNYLAEVGSLFPVITASFSAERERFSNSFFGGSTNNQGANSGNNGKGGQSGGNTPSNPSNNNSNSITSGASTFNLYNASVNVSYTFDVFGGIRRQIESAAAKANYQQFQLEAAYLTLTANIVTTAINEASIRAQIKATEELVTIQQKLLKIIQTQYKLGSASLADVLTQQTEVAQTSATLPPLEKNLALLKDSMAILVGDLPSTPVFSDFNLECLHLPTKLPVSVPSTLVRQRPDIRAAEATMHAAMAQIGVTTANLFPKFTLSGLYSSQPNDVQHLFDPSTIVWNIMGQATQTIFQGGTLIAQRRSSIAAFQQTAAQYKQTVLLAFQNVADSLNALIIDVKTFQAQVAAETAARQSMILTEKQYLLGGADYLNLLNAQNQYKLATINRIQAEAARYSDTAALFQALGGGWWNRPPLPDLPLSTKMDGMWDQPGKNPEFLPPPEGEG